MFKDYDKYLSASLKVYIFILIIVFIMKLVGLNYFGLDVNNAIILKVNKIVIQHWYIKDIINLTTLTIQSYFYLCMVCKKRKLYKEAFIISLINIITQIILIKYFELPLTYQFVCFLLIIGYPIIITKKIQIKRQIICILLIYLYQFLSLFIRNIGVANNFQNFIIDVLLNIDQLIMLAITYKLYFMKGDVKICQEQVVGFYLQMKKNLLKLPKKLQKFSCKFEQLDKEEKATYIIYFILSLIWNLFTIFIVLLVATLNDTIIECIFILVSFWISKKIFKKAFHLKSMVQCFILSNVSYYILNQITTPIGVSILVPIMLGTGLAYTTSKLVKDIYKPLYKGMPLDEFNKTILKVVDKDSLKYMICYDYYIERENAVFLGRKYSYTEAGIRQIASRINKQIKALN